MSDPVFAVVGHPNKGKSSIVATLAEDDSVQIAPEPGTTVRCRRYPMRVDDQVLYTLVDTPGFQRARAALDWLRRQAPSAAERPAAVEAFVRTQRACGAFFAECELLAPLFDGAGILYVVDGSRPYGQEYEAEMEILRWTGQPSMALINPIGGPDHVDRWAAALTQYFKVVRVFNAHTAPFAKRLELLRAFGQLREEWRGPLERAVASLEAERVRRRSASAAAIAAMLADMLALTASRRLDSAADAARLEPVLAAEYRQMLRRREGQGRDEVQRIYGHRRVERHEPAFDLVEQDLFSRESWLLWGLSRRQTLTGGAAAGAAVGGAVDVAVGGSSLLLGAAIGALVGGASAWLTYARVGDVRLLGLPLGGCQLRVGPARDPALGFVVLGRAVYHHLLIASWSHARRQGLDVGEARQAGASGLAAPQRRALERTFARLRRAGPRGAPQGALAELAGRIEPLLDNDT